MAVHPPFNIEVSLTATLYYIIGYECRERVLRLNSRWLLIVLLAVVHVVLSQLLPGIDMATNHCGLYGLNALNAIIGTLTVFLFAKKIQAWNACNWLRKFFLWAGVNTIVVLGLSQVVNMTMKGTMESLPIPNVVNSLLRHTLLWIMLWILATFINKYIPEVIGKNRKIYA